MKLSLTIIIVALLFLSSCSTTKWTHGTWTGVGKQIDNATWDVKLNVSDNDEFKIEYPTLSCGGTWTITGNSKSSSKTSGSGKSVTLKLMLKESIEFRRGEFYPWKFIFPFSKCHLFAEENGI